MTKRLNIEKGTRFGMLTVIKEVEPYRSKWGNFRQLCLADFTPRELMAELKRRGYEGKITYVETHTIDLSTL